MPWVAVPPAARRSGAIGRELGEVERGDFLEMGHVKDTAVNGLKGRKEPKLFA